MPSLRPLNSRIGRNGAVGLNIIKEKMFTTPGVHCLVGISGDKTTGQVRRIYVVTVTPEEWMPSMIAGPVSCMSESLVRIYRKPSEITL